MTYILTLIFRYKTSERALSFNEDVPVRTIVHLLRCYCRRITGQAQQWNAEYPRASQVPAEHVRYTAPSIPLGRTGYRKHTSHSQP
jgi:hypothetical protein